MFAFCSFLFCSFLLCQVQTPSKKKVELSTIASNYHIEMNPRSVVIASARQVCSTLHVDDVCTNVCVYKCLCVQMSVCTNVCVYKCMCVHMPVCAALLLQ